TVALAPAAFPVSGVHSYKIYSNIFTVASPFSLCDSGTSVLSLGGDPTTDADSYQWQSSPTGANTYTDIAAATTAAYTTTTLTSSTDFRCVIKCSGVPIAIGNSTAATVYVANPQVTSTTPNFGCGTGSVALSGTGST